MFISFPAIADERVELVRWHLHREMTRLAINIMAVNPGILGFDPFDTIGGIHLACHRDLHEESVGDANTSTC